MTKEKPSWWCSACCCCCGGSKKPRDFARKSGILLVLCGVVLLVNWPYWQSLRAVHRQDPLSHLPARIHLEVGQTKERSGLADRGMEAKLNDNEHQRRGAATDGIPRFKQDFPDTGASAQREQLVKPQCQLVLHPSPLGGSISVNSGSLRECIVFRVSATRHLGEIEADNAPRPWKETDSFPNGSRSAILSAWNFEWKQASTNERNVSLQLSHMRCPECIFNHAAYASLAGAEYLVGNTQAADVVLEGRVGYYVKIWMLREALLTYEPVLWIDADAWFNNFDIRMHGFFEPSHYPEAASANIAQASIVMQEGYWLNTAVMLFRRSNWTDFVLAETWEVAPTFSRHPADQVALQHSLQVAFELSLAASPLCSSSTAPPRCFAAAFSCVDKGLHRNDCWLRGLAKEHCDAAFYCVEGHRASFFIAVDRLAAQMAAPSAVLCCAHSQPAFHNESLQERRQRVKLEQRRGYWAGSRKGKCVGRVWVIHAQIASRAQLEGWRQLAPHSTTLGIAYLAR